MKRRLAAEGRPPGHGEAVSVARRGAGLAGSRPSGALAPAIGPGGRSVLALRAPRGSGASALFPWVP